MNQFGRGVSELEAAIITTYRCISRCERCFIWKHPTKEEEEFKPDLLNRLPSLSFCNVTGGEPFLRDDLGEIIDILSRKAKRIVISTNGYLTNKIIEFVDAHPGVGIRISIEGLPTTHDELRGVQDGFDRAFRTLLELKQRRTRDLGIAVTLSDKNVVDLLPLFYLAKAMKIEFATAVVHNSYYFHTQENSLLHKKEIISSLDMLLQELIKTWRVKNWYRALFNYGMIEHVRGHPRLFPCTAGTDLFFLDPWGEIRPCNGMDENSGLMSFGNLRSKPFSEIWNSEQARKIRASISSCPKNCWMVGTASPAMKKNFLRSTAWVIGKKIKSHFNRSG